MSLTDNRRLIVHEQIESPIAEAYRTLRTNIHFSNAAGDLKVIIFTSAGPREGKSTTVANTGIALAKIGKKVIILDCDLRKSVQHKIFDKKNQGLTNILVGDIPITNLIQETEIDNLRIITSGPLPPNPSELLSSKAMEGVLDYLRKEVDYIIIDAPPAIAVTDACILAAKADGVVLVLDTCTIKPEMAQKAKELLLKAKAHFLGVVLNRIEFEEEQAYYYYYYNDASQTVTR